MINYAHRGASEYAPENTISSFYLGLIQGANGIETDVQITKDRQLVLFHDDTLDRVTNACGKISDYTLEQLKKIKVYGNSGRQFYDRIPTLDEFLQRFSGYDISFAIELKFGGYEKQVIDLCIKHNIVHKTTVTGFSFDCIKNVKAIDKNISVGWLIKNPTQQDIQALLDIGGEEMAPQASCITPELVNSLRAKGLRVRAWGVRDIATMKKMCEMKVDGMTVNFPDKLFDYLNLGEV